MMTNGVFLEEIEFTDNFPPFEKGTKVKFGDEMKKILEFYLRNKWLKEGSENEEVEEIEEQAKSVAERMKINVIVGENGTGKSRLFKGMTESEKLVFEDKDDLIGRRVKDTIVSINKGEITLNKSNSFLDKMDFFSSNNDSQGYNQIISGLFILLNSLKENIRKGLIKFINLKSESVKIKLEIRTPFIYTSVSNGTFNWFEENINKNGLNLDDSELWKFYKLLFSPKNNGSTIIGDELKFEREVYKLLNEEEKKKYFYYYCIGTGIFENLIVLMFMKDGKGIENKGDLEEIYSSQESTGLNLIILLLKNIYDAEKRRIYQKKYIKPDHKLNGLDDNLVEEKEFFRKLDNCKSIDDLKCILKQVYENIKDGFNVEISYSDNLLNTKLKKGFFDKIFDFDLNFYENGNFKKSFRRHLSSGEKIILYRFGNIDEFMNDKLGYRTLYILIDEPDLHLHLDWQRQYIQKLIDVFAEFLKENTGISLHFIIATHSPFILSDVPAENVILLQKGDDGYTKVTDWKEKKGTFGANFVDLIRNGFFFDTKNLMGSFAEEVIDKIAQIEKDEIIKNKEVKDLSKIKKNIKEKIGDSFLKDNLLYFKKSDAENRSKK